MSYLEISRLHRRFLLWACLVYAGLVVLYGSARILAGNTVVLAAFSHPHAQPGYGHQLVRLFDAVTLVKPLEPFLMRDFLTAACLFLAALVVGFCAAVTRGASGSEGGSPRFLAVLAVGFAYLGADELFLIHEFFGLNLAFLLYPHAPGLELLEYDFNGHIIVLYALIGLAVLVVKRRFFLSSRIGLLLLVGGLWCQGFAAAVDFLWNRLAMLQRLLGPLGFLVFRDEFLELTAAFLYLCAFTIYGAAYAARHCRFVVERAVQLPVVVGLQQADRPDGRRSERRSGDADSAVDEECLTGGAKSSTLSKAPSSGHER